MKQFSLLYGLSKPPRNVFKQFQSNGFFSTVPGELKLTSSILVDLWNHINYDSNSETPRITANANLTPMSFFRALVVQTNLATPGGKLARQINCSKLTCLKVQPRITNYELFGTTGVEKNGPHLLPIAKAMSSHLDSIFKLPRDRRRKEDKIN